MINKLIMFAAAIAIAVLSSNTAKASEATDIQIGVGAHYWVFLDDLDTNFDDNALSYYASFRYNPSLVGFELNLEYYPEETMFRKAAYEPQAFFIVGHTIYGGIGAGWLYTDNDWADDPTYAFKAGVNLKLFELVGLDINANYRFNTFDDIDVDMNTITLGAALRLCF